MMGIWTKCEDSCADPMWCIQRQICKKETMKDAPSPLNAEILGLVRHKHDVYDALFRLVCSLAPGIIPAEDTLGLINQLSNAIAGLRQSGGSVGVGTEVFVVVADDLEIEHNISWVAGVFLTEDEAKSYVAREKREEVWTDWRKRRDAWMAINYPRQGPDAEKTWPRQPDGDMYGFCVFKAVLGRDVPASDGAPRDVA